jgi:hypothetical protein
VEHWRSLVAQSLAEGAKARGLPEVRGDS